jgi:hypothetical protein
MPTSVKNKHKELIKNNLFYLQKIINFPPTVGTHVNFSADTYGLCFVTWEGECIQGLLAT